MHGTGLLGGAFAAMNMGGTIVTLPGRRFDPDALWRAVERECVTDITIVGDVFAKPMLAALRDARAAGRPYDVSSGRQLFSRSEERRVGKECVSTCRSRWLT